MILESALILDSDNARRERLRDILQFLGCEHCTAVSTHGDSPEVWRPGEVDLCLVGECGGTAARAGVVHSLLARDDNLPVFLLDAPEAAVELGALVLGALTEPVDFAQMHDAIARARARRRQDAARSARVPDGFRALVGNSRAIVEARAAIARVASTDAPVLVLGEPGSGKEIAARRVHYQSPRRDAPFVHLNCGAVPPALAGDELFGATGRFARAAGGTLFLDGIAEIAPELQARLLQVIDEGHDVRLVAAGAPDLEQAVDAGRLRADLYYRLGGFPVVLPPLRERVDDIPLLVHELVTRMEHSGTGAIRLTPLAIVALCACPWPGNVRELANLVERLAILHPGRVVDLDDLPERYRGPASHAAAPAWLGQMAGDPWRRVPRLPREGLDLREHLFQVEQDIVEQALAEANGVVTHAARRLGMRRTTLIERLRKHGRGGRVH